MQSLVQKAKDDLARRLSVPAEQINLVEATEVEWSDSSLDCPKPGMAYLQVITPGYRIVLESGGKRYEYHSNRDNYVVYCESPGASIPAAVAIPETTAVSPLRGFHRDIQRTQGLRPGLSCVAPPVRVCGRARIRGVFQANRRQ